MHALNHHLVKRTSEDVKILQKWHRNNRIFTTPSTVNDDLYLIYASLYARTSQPTLLQQQTSITNNKINNPPPSHRGSSTINNTSTTSSLYRGGNQGEFTSVITNDLMRDHWHHMLPLIAFERYRQTQVLNFNINKMNGKVNVNPPPYYTPVLQCTDSQRKGVSKRTWHLPSISRYSQDWSRNTRDWLVVQLDMPISEAPT